MECFVVRGGGGVLEPSDLGEHTCLGSQLLLKSPRPSWPLRPSPKTTTRPERSRRTVWYAPAATSATDSFRLHTRRGESTVSKWPSPSAPLLPSPNVYTSPRVERATEWFAPAAAAMTRTRSRSSAAMGLGAATSSVSSWPSMPKSPEPHERSVPSTATSNEWLRDAHAWLRRNANAPVFGNATRTGKSTSSASRFGPSPSLPYSSCPHAMRPPPLHRASE
eukprot:4329488-Pleurochrysis_carterae.AAC.3